MAFETARCGTFLVYMSMSARSELGRRQKLFEVSGPSKGGNDITIQKNLPHKEDGLQNMQITSNDFTNLRQVGVIIKHKGRNLAVYFCTQWLDKLMNLY